MSQKIGIEVVVNSNIKNETQDANKFNEALKRAAQTAKSIGVAASAGGTAGSQRATQMSQPVLAGQTVEYGRARGSAGATGASARDFANQSQGLGGLVRLYATYAANVFAVGAAFRALSTAMDTANMVRGLDQIGAASGVALGGLSRQLVSATGGAISLREAMSATVKVTSAGLGSENVLRLGTVAAKASQALGVDLGDAVNRLSRGITKLEPELLDELGIFTKIEPAVEKYALSIGKSASSLTDFERRQAFANAVLEEGEKKFAAIKVDANPYNKLAAALQNIAQSGLELVNKVLAPIVNFLSESPTALITALAGVGLALVRQIAPAFGQFRENIRKANVEAADAAKARSQQAIKIQQDLDTKLIQLADRSADEQVQRLDQAETRLRNLQTKLGTRTKAGIILAEKPDTADITDKDVADIRAAAKKAETRGNLELAKAQTEVADSIMAVKTAEEEVAKQKGVSIQQLQNDLRSKRTIIGLNAQLAQSITNASFKQEVVSNAAYAGSLVGPTRAIKLMLAELKSSEIQLGAFSRATVIAKGSLAAFAGAAATMGAYLNSALGAIGLIAAALSILTTVFSETTRESKDTSSALDLLEQNTKNLNNTIDVINKKPILEQFSTQSILARSNALESLNSSIEKVITTSSKELAAMGLVDIFIDNLKKLWGGDVVSKATAEISRGLAAAFSDAATANSEAGKAAKQTLTSLLGKDIDLSNFKQIESALNSLSRQDYAKAVEVISNEISKLSRSAKEPAIALQGLDDSLKKLADARQKFIAGLLPTDSFTEFGRILITTSIDFANALKNPASELETIKKLFEEIKRLPVPADMLLGLESAKNIAEDLQVSRRELEATNTSIEEITGKIAVQQERLIRVYRREGYEAANAVRAEINKLGEDLTALTGKKGAIELNVSVKQQGLDQLKDTINKGVIATFDAGTNIVASKLSAEFVKAGATITQTFASALGNTEAGIKLRAQAEKQMLAAQLAQIKAQELQIRATADNTLELKKDRLSRLEQRKAAEPGLEGIGAEIAAVTKEINDFKSVLAPGSTYAKVVAEQRKEANFDPQNPILKLAEQLEASRAAAANISANMFAADYKKTLDLLDLENARVLKRKQSDIDALKASQQLFASNEQINSSLNESALLARRNYELAVEEAEQDLRRTQVQQEITRQEKIRADIKGKGPEAQEARTDIGKQIQNLKLFSELSERVFETKRQETQQKNAIELVKIRSANEVKANELAFAGASRLLQIQDDAIELDRQRFDIDKQRFQLTQSFVIQEEAAQKRAEARQNAAKALLEAEKARRTEEQSTEAKRQQILATPVIIAEGEAASPAQAQALASQLAAIEELNVASARTTENYQYSVDRINQLLTGQLATIEAQKELNLQQEKYNTYLKDTSQFAENIKNAFQGLGETSAKIGEGFGNLVNALAQSAVASDENSKAVANWTSKVEELKEKEKTVTEADDAGLLSRQRVKAQEQLAKATSKQQKDEISGYAKMAGAAKNMFKEKTVAHRALAVAERGFHIARLAMDIKEFAIKMGLISKEQVAKLAAGAKDIAMKANNALVSIGIDIPAIYAKTIGQLGIFGPPVAAAMIAAFIGSFSKGGGSSAASLGMTAAQRQETQGTSLRFNAATGQNEQYRTGVFGAPDEKTESIKNSLEILRDNSVVGLSYDNKLLKSFEELARNLDSFAKAVYTIPGIVSGSAFGTPGSTTSTSGITGLFGSKTTKEIVDSGIAIKGTINEIIAGGNGVLQIYETIQTTKKSSGLLGIGSSTRTNVSELFKDLGDVDPRSAQLFLDGLESGVDVLVELSGELLGSTDALETALATLPQDLRISLRGLSGEDLLAAINSAYGTILADISEATFGSIVTTYRQFGEDALQTAVRVVDSNTKIEQALGNISRDGGVTQLGIELTEALATMAGGLEEFLDDVDAFAQNFLTDEERLAPLRKSVQAELDALGLGWITTREQFKNTIQYLEDTGQTGTASFVRLLGLSEDFAAVTEGIDDISKSLKSAYKDRVDELKDARKEFQNFANSLRDFQQSLKTGSLSPLTPLEQYNAARTLFEETRVKAAAGDTKAIGSLSKVSSDFLTLSQKMYASSDQYIGDYNMVSSAIDSTITFAELQIDIANDTLTEMKNVFGAIVDLEDTVEDFGTVLTGWGTTLTDAYTNFTSQSLMGPINVIGGDVASLVASNAASQSAPIQTATVAAAVTPIPEPEVPFNYSNYFGAAMGAAFDYGGVRKFARGGIVNGLTPFSYSSGLGVMGEAGPEAIMPLRRTPSGNLGVISMAGNGDMLRELARLNQQVETLTQAVSEGAVINAQATDRNTEAVVGAVTDKTVNNVYQTRLKDKVQVV